MKLLGISPWWNKFFCRKWHHYFPVCSLNENFVQSNTNFENSLIYWNQNNITRQKWWGKVLSLVWNENLVFYIFSTYTGKSNLESYIFISFVKLMENNFIEFLSWNQWKMISFNDKDLIGRLFMTTSQRFVLNQ